MLEFLVTSTRDKLLQDLVFLIRDSQFLDPFGWESGQRHLQVTLSDSVSSYILLERFTGRRRFSFCYRRLFPLVVRKIYSRN